MNRPKKTIGRVAVLAALFILACGIVAPFVSAERFGEGIRQALRRSLHREVEIAGKVRFSLFAGPGFTISDVIIHEDPAVGLEPLAYVSSLEARVRLWSLWRGRLDFSTLRLVEPSVNLARSGAGPWNFQPILERAFGSRPPVTPMPQIQVRSGRLNFRTGDTKSVYYFSNADMDVNSSTAGRGVVEIRFSGEPARTDRSAQSFGRLSGRARWLFSPDGESRLEGSLRLERSAIAEVMTLLRGHGVALDGFLAMQARLTGPVNDIAVSGQLQLEEIQRWQLISSQGEEWSLNYRGRLDLSRHQIELETTREGKDAWLVSVRFRAWDYLTSPRWALAMTLEQLPLEVVAALSRQMGAGPPEKLSVQGKLTGAIGYSAHSGLQGLVNVQEAVVAAPESPEIRISEARVLLENRRIQLSPVLFQIEDGPGGRAELRYLSDRRQVDLRINAQSMDIPGFVRAWGQLSEAASTPVLEACRQGRWNGSLRFLREGDMPGEWSGEFGLQDAQVPLAGFSDPLTIESALVTVRHERVDLRRMKARLGDVALEGRYRQEAGAARPHHFELVVPKLDAAALERLLLPTLRRRQGLLARTLRLRPAPLPDWLKSRHAEGTLRVEELTFGPYRFESVRARLVWDGADLELRNLESEMAGGLFTGQLFVSLRHGEPTYRAATQIHGMKWKEGRIDAEGWMETSGTGEELWLNLRSEGSFEARSISLGPDAHPRALLGRYELSVARGVPRLHFPSVEIAWGSETYHGQGTGAPDGRVQLELSGAGRQLRLAGTIVPPQLEVQEPR